MEFKGLPDPELNRNSNIPYIEKTEKDKWLNHEVSASVSSSSLQKESQLFEKNASKSSIPTVPKSSNPSSNSLSFEEASKILKNDRTDILGSQKQVDKKITKVAVKEVFNSLNLGSVGYKSALKEVQQYSKTSTDKLLKISGGNENVNQLLKVGQFLKMINEGGNIRSHEIRFENISPEILKYFLDELEELQVSNPNLANNLVNELFNEYHEVLTERSDAFSENQLDNMLYLVMNLRLGGKNGMAFHEFDSLEIYPYDLLKKMDPMIHVSLKTILDEVKFLNEVKIGLIDKNLNNNEIRAQINRLNELKDEYPNSNLIESVYDLANNYLKEQSLGDTQNKEELNFSLDLIANVLIREGDECKYGLTDFKEYSEDLIDKLIQNTEIKTETREMLSLSKILTKFEKQILDPNVNINVAIENLQNQLPESLSIHTAQRLYNELEKFSVPQLESFKNELKQTVYLKFTEMLHREEPGSSEFKNNFDGLSRETVKLCAPRFLKEIYVGKKQYRDNTGINFYKGKIDKNNKDTNLYKGCLEGVSRMFPEIADDYCDDSIFKLRAIDLLVQKLQSNENSFLSKVDYQSFSIGYDNEKLLNSIKNIDRSSNQQLEWMINYPNSPHVAPMHIRVQDGHVDIVVTDSLGSSDLGDGRTMHSEFAENISDILSKIENTEHFSIYWGESLRQVDGSNCPIFSLTDMKEFVNHPELFDEIKEMSKSQDDKISGGGIRAEARTFGEMPVRLMRYNQSVTKLNAKVKALESELEQLKNNQAPDNQVKKIEGDIQLLNQMIVKNVKTGMVDRTEKMMNVFAVERYRKYEALIISQLLEVTLANQ